MEGAGFGEQSGVRTDVKGSVLPHVRVRPAVGDHGLACEAEVRVTAAGSHLSGLLGSLQAVE